MTAAEALRKARGTMACWHEPGHPDAIECELAWPTTVYQHFSGIVGEVHPILASALLDGFTVEEITEAGG